MIDKLMHSMVFRWLGAAVLMLLSSAAAREATLPVSLPGQGALCKIRSGDTEEDVIRCLGAPRGSVSMPEVQKKLLYYGTGSIELRQGAVFSMTLPDDGWAWTMAGDLYQEEILSGDSSVCSWQLQVDHAAVAQGVWDCGGLGPVQHR